MINVIESLKKVDKYFSPEVVGEVNDVYIKLAKIKGDKVPWHTHKDEDELFYVVEGCLLMEVEDEKGFIMNVGDMFIVKKGIHHRVSSTEECSIMLIENKFTKHTGDVKSEITKSIEDQLK